MRQYVVDELRPDDQTSLKAYLDENLVDAGLDGLYWKTIDSALLTDKQSAHIHCAPFYVALVLTEESLACELLVRTRNRIRCDCMGYATPKQRDWIIGWVDDVFNKLEIIS